MNLADLGEREPPKGLGMFKTLKTTTQGFGKNELRGSWVAQCVEGICRYPFIRHNMSYTFSVAIRFL